MKATQGIAGARRPLVRALSGVLGGIAVLCAGPAGAVKFGSESIKGSFDSTISFGVQTRMQGTSCSIIGNDNGGCVPTVGTLQNALVAGGDAAALANPDFNYLNADDGNLNYGKGDVVGMALKGTHDLALKWGEGWTWGFLTRFTWIKDWKIADTDRTELADDAKQYAAENVTLLDYYISKDFTVGGRPLKVRVGNQVISWGEDIFIYGGVNVVNALDLRKAHVPGVQLKEIFRPAQMASFNAGVTETVSVEGYYQFKWNHFELDPVGTYFSAADVVGKGSTQPAYVPSSLAGLLLPGVTTTPGSVGDVGTISNGNNIPAGQRFTAAQLAAIGSVVPKYPDIKPETGGQYGLSVRYKPAGAETEYGAYYLRYHDKLPTIGFLLNNANPFAGLGYFVDYGSDRDLFGLSMNTKVGEWAVGAEISYRPRDSVGIDPTVPGPTNPYSVFNPINNGFFHGYVEEKKYQGHLTGFTFISPSGWLGGLLSGVGASEGFILAEAAATYYPGLDGSGFVPYLLPNYELPDKFSYGYVFEMGLTYPNAFGSGLNVTPQIDWYHDVGGTSPNLVPFVQGRKTLALSLNFDYQSVWKGQLGYTIYWGGGGNNLLQDRDFLSLSISRSF